MNIIESVVTWEDKNNPEPIYAFEELFDFVEEIYPNCPYAVYAYIFNTMVGVSSQSKYVYVPYSAYEMENVTEYRYRFDSERLTKYLNSKLSKLNNEHTNI